jgi:hypothetical protein
MAKWILIDELHVSVRAPQGLAEAEYEAMSRALNRRRFRAGVRAAVRNVVRRYAALRKVRVVLSR